jgi:TolB-like protein/DNA-binding winged helix-turn-helix (wHTH) protein/Flp pilus assembly protein TadD
MATLHDHGFMLEDWRVFPAEGTLVHEGETVHLEPKVMDVLVYFATHPGAVVTRDELERDVWRGALVGYDAVTATVIKLRKALHDNSKHPHIIATIPKKGYQLLTEVHDIENPPLTTAETQPSPTIAEIQPSPTIAETQPSPTTTIAPPITPRSRSIPTAYLFGAAAIVILAAVLAGVWQLYPPAPAPSVPSLLVLPIENLDNDAAHEVFVDGVTEDIITDLSRMAGLMVFASNTTFKYKGQRVTPQSLHEALKADYVLTGSARRLGDMIRINMELINAATGFNVWAQRYDRKLSEVFAIQDDVTTNLVNSLAIKLSSQEKQRMGRHATNNIKAYQLFLEGQRISKEYTRQASAQALELYQQAVKIDPTYGRAYGAMGFILGQDYARGWTDHPQETLDRAMALAKQGVALDDSIPQTYWSLGYVHMRRREHKLAEQAATQAIRIAPNYADAYGLLALINNFLGDGDKALAYAQRGMQLNPYYTWDYLFNVGLAHYLLGDYNQAITYLEKAQARNENVIPVKVYLAAAYARVGRQDDAEWTTEQLRLLNPSTTLKHLSDVVSYSDPKLTAEVLEDLRKAGLPEE